MTNLTAAEILASLDLAAVEAAILNDDEGNPTLLAHEFTDAKAMLVACVEKWLVSDLNHLTKESLGLEERFDINLGGYPTRGYLDLRGQYYRGQEEGTGTPLKGRVVIADWKTTAGDLDLTWQNRLIDSKQWRLYASVPPSAEYISYRGVNPKGKTREVFLKAYTVPNLLEDVTEYMSGVGDMMTAISHRDLWVQNKPSACGMYGTTCPFKADCDNGTSPRYLLPAAEIALSYSGAQRFLQCPERYRRIKTAQAGIDGSDATRIGTATHAGLEEVWRQAFAQYGV